MGGVNWGILFLTILVFLFLWLFFSLFGHWFKVNNKTQKMKQQLLKNKELVKELDLEKIFSDIAAWLEEDQEKKKT